MGVYGNIKKFRKAEEFENAARQIFEDLHLTNGHDWVTFHQTLGDIMIKRGKMFLDKAFDAFTESNRVL